MKTDYNTTEWIIVDAQRRAAVYHWRFTAAMYLGMYACAIRWQRLAQTEYAQARYFLNKLHTQPIWPPSAPSTNPFKPGSTSRPTPEDVVRTSGRYTLLVSVRP